MPHDELDEHQPTAEERRYHDQQGQAELDAQIHSLIRVLPERDPHDIQQRPQS